MLVNKPQFDTNELKQGDAYRVDIQSRDLFSDKTRSGKTQTDKFCSGDNLLLIGINPLHLVLLTWDKKEVKVNVEDVASGEIVLQKLVVQTLHESAVEDNTAKKTGGRMK